LVAGSPDAWVCGCTIIREMLNAGTCDPAIVFRHILPLDLLAFWFASVSLLIRLKADLQSSPSAPNMQTTPVDIKIKEGAVTMFGGSRRPWVLAIPNCVAMLLFRDTAWLSGRVCRENCYNRVVIFARLQISVRKAKTSQSTALEPISWPSRVPTALRGARDEVCLPV
jgi:hypothetical protein